MPMYDEDNEIDVSYLDKPTENWKTRGRTVYKESYYKKQILDMLFLMQLRFRGVHYIPDCYSQLKFIEGEDYYFVKDGES